MSIDILKSRILQALFVVFVDMANESVELKVHMDATQCALGGFLLACVEGNWRLVAYHSCNFSSVEVSCSTIECKLLKIVNSLHHFHQSLLGRKFHVCTDHSH